MNEQPFLSPEDITPEPQAPRTAAEAMEAMDKLAEELFAQDAKIEEMKKLLTVENKKLMALEQKFAAFLEESGRKNYPSPKGTISFRETWRFNLPKSDEDKAAFSGWLKEQGLYEAYVTFNSNSYNSLLLTEWKNAEKEGRGMEFSIPGVPEPVRHKSIVWKGNKS